MATKKKLLQVSGGGEDYWIATLTRTSYITNFYGVAVDSSDNIIAVGRTSGDGAGNYDGLIVKYDSSGQILWQKTLGDNLADNLWRVAVDSSDNIYVSGYAVFASRDMLLAKIASDGTLSWYRGLGGSVSDESRGIVIDSSGDIIIGGYGEPYGSTSDIYSYLVKYNSSGSVQWERGMGSSNDTLYGQGVDVDSSGNIYLAAYGTQVGSTADGFLQKVSSTGSSVWGRQITSGVHVANDYFFDVAVDSSGNPIAAGYTYGQGQGDSDLLVAKYNSSGVIQWQKVYGTSGIEWQRQITLDSSDNIYTSGRYSGGSGYEILLVKLNSSGVIQWAKTIGNPSYSEDAWGITLDSNDNIVIAGTAYVGANGGLVARFPSGGPENGTYGDFTIADVSLTEATGTRTDASYNFSAQNTQFSTTKTSTGLTFADSTNLVDDLTSL